MNDDEQHSVLMALSQIGPHLPATVRIDDLPAQTPKGPAGHKMVYDHVFHLLFDALPVQPPADFALCPEEYALTLLYMAVKWPHLQVFGNLELIKRNNETAVHVPPQYCPSAPVLRKMRNMLPLNAESRTCFSNGRLCFGQPVNPALGDANELLLVFYDEMRMVTIYAWEAID